MMNRLNPDYFQKKNSRAILLLLYTSFLHLLAMVVYQIPFFHETTISVGDFSLPLVRTIGLNKYVLMQYDGMPMCYPPGGPSSDPVPCNNPLSLGGMLPVMLILIILYFQRMVYASEAYSRVIDQMNTTEKRRMEKQMELRRQVERDAIHRHEGMFRMMIVNNNDNG